MGRLNRYENINSVFIRIKQKKMIYLRTHEPKKTDMKNNKSNLKLTNLASGAAILSTFGLTAANAAELLKFEDLGSASELRSSLLTTDAINAFTSNTDVEFECGEGKCGEGKCGEKSTKKEDNKGDKAAAKPAADGEAPPAKAASETKPAAGATMQAAPADKSSAKPATKSNKAETKPAAPKN